MTRRTGCADALAAAVAISLASAASAGIVFVNHAATGANNGQSWANAFTTLQAGVGAAQAGDQVWVAKGTYRPAGPGGDRDTAFVLKSGVEVYGGFAGNETTLAQRNPLLNITILSGDLNGNDLPGFVNIAENSRHVLTATGVSAATLLDGFTVRGGNADFQGEQLLGGGGLFILNGSLTVRGCVFTANSAGLGMPTLGNFGGGLHIKIQTTNSDVLISQCRFEGNRANAGGAMGVHNDGVGVPHRVRVEDTLFLANQALNQTGGAVWTGSSPFNEKTHQELSFTRCRFEGNAAGYAGAIIDQNTLHFSLVDCEFIANSMKVTGGAVWHLQTAQKDLFAARVHGCLFMDNPGGAIVLASTSADVVNCTFLGNGSPSASGAIVLGPYVFGCGRSLMVAGCLFSGNEAVSGAAIRSTCAEGVEVVNSTFAGNAASNGSGAVFSIAPLSVSNSVLWGNTLAGSQTQAAQLASSGLPIALNHSAVMGLTGSLGGIGNIGTDPMFADPLGPDGIAGTLDDDLRLESGSPAIDAASNPSVPGFLKSDLDGNARFVDDPAAPNTGVPGGAGGSAIVDMGAYEVQGAVCYPDCNNDLSLTIADFGCFQAMFVSGSAYADCNGSGTLTIADFGCFQSAFVAGCP